MMSSKQWLLLLALSLSLAGCNKKAEQYDFHIVCKTPSGLYSPSRDAELFISGPEGRVLGSFKIGAEEAEFERSLQIDEDIKTCDIHLIVRYGGPVWVYTHLGVQNGALVVFEPSWFVANSGFAQTKVARVEGVQSLDSLGFLGGQFVQWWHDPSQSLASASTHFYPNQGAVLYGRANGQPNYRYLYLSDSVLTSFESHFYVHWNQLKPAPPPASVTTSAALPPAREMFVDAIFPDQKRFVSIGPGTRIDSSNLQFTQPEEVPRALRIRLNGHRYAAEKIFQPGEPLQFGMTDMRIGNISSTPGKGFKIETSGDIDLLEVKCAESQYYIWKIEGKPSAFRDATMPNLSELLRTNSTLPPFPTPFWRFQVRAYQFGKHDYPQVREGFPFRSGDLFPVARSGYFMIEKSFF